MVQSLSHTANSKFLSVLLKAMYLVAFHCFLRLGEFTSHTGKNNHLLKVENVKFSYEHSSVPAGFELTINSYKHSQGKQHTMYVQSNTKNTDLCPVLALWKYLLLRKTASGPLFAIFDGSPISRKFFTEQLNLSLIWCDLDPKLYKGHSFRIGAATTAAAEGISEEKIRAMGRWSSDAVKKYFRIPVLSLQ